MPRARALPVALDQPRPMITATETARRLGVSHRTVWRFVASGKLTAYRHGPRIVRFNPGEVDKLLRPMPAATKRSA